jgi:hypothetical protein
LAQNIIKLAFLSSLLLQTSKLECLSIASLFGQL